MLDDDSKVCVDLDGIKCSTVLQCGRQADELNGIELGVRRRHWLESFDNDCDGKLWGDGL